MALYSTEMFDVVRGEAGIGGEVPPRIPAKVQSASDKYLSLREGEQLVLLADETLLGSGKEGIAVTTERLLSYDKAKLKLNLAFVGLHAVKAGKIDHADGLIIRRSADRTVPLRIAHASESEVALIAAVVSALLARERAPQSEWTCPACGPGQVIRVGQVRCAAGAGEAALALIGNELHVCRSCGRAGLRFEREQALRLQGIEGAELRSSGG